MRKIPKSWHKTPYEIAELWSGIETAANGLTRLAKKQYPLGIELMAKKILANKKAIDRTKIANLSVK